METHEQFFFFSYNLLGWRIGWVWEAEAENSQMSLMVLCPVFRPLCPVPQ